jgi:proteic killer suppression protein
VIRSIRHKALAGFYASGSSKGLDARHVPKLRLILTALDAAQEPDDLRLPSFRLHKLSGDREGQWSVTVQANWRIVFRFDGTDVADVDLVDYH